MPVDSGPDIWDPQGAGVHPDLVAKLQAFVASGSQSATSFVNAIGSAIPGAGLPPPPAPPLCPAPQPSFPPAVSGMCQCGIANNSLPSAPLGPGTAAGQRFAQPAPPRHATAPAAPRFGTAPGPPHTSANGPLPGVSGPPPPIGFVAQQARHNQAAPSPTVAACSTGGSPHKFWGSQAPLRVCRPLLSRGLEPPPLQRAARRAVALLMQRRARLRLLRSSKLVQGADST